MELALKPADRALANARWGIDGEVAHRGMFDNCNNDRSRTGITADHVFANPPYANFPWVRRCS